MASGVVPDAIIHLNIQLNAIAACFSQLRFIKRNKEGF